MTSSKNSAVVRTQGLTKVFRDFWLRDKVTAVSDLNLEIRPREVYGLLGPNGSGKSTTLKMILGLLFPTQGTISVFGKHPTNVQVKSSIGFLPEETHLYPFLDARETLEFYAKLFHQPRKQRNRRIDMLLEMVGLTGASYRRVGEYSKGMQRRIGLAQALINDPELLILDEPTSGLDPIGTKQFKDLIVMLAERGKTVVLSSHLLGDVEDVCDRVSILYGGKLRKQGHIEELLEVKDRTQITVDDIPPQALEQIQNILFGKDIEISHPRQKLETLFLEIVEQARQSRLATGGAMAGGRLAEFLTAAGAEQKPQTGEALIESLVTAEPEITEVDQQQIEQEKQQEAIREQQENILGDLVSRAAEPEAEEKDEASSKAPQAPMADNSQADQSVLGELLSEDETGEDK